MTSAIEYSSINENFPVPGQDNDTQVFRDNFNTIKTSLGTASSEITALQGDYVSLTTDNPFAGNRIENAVLRQVREEVIDGTGLSGSNLEVDWQAGSYHVYFVDGDASFQFTNLPGDQTLPNENTAKRSVGRLTLELYSNDDQEHEISFTVINGAEFRKDPDFPATVTVNSSSNPVIIEVWRRTAVNSKDYIFLRYLGQYE